MNKSENADLTAKSRLTDEENRKLLFIEKNKNTTRSGAIRFAIEFTYNNLKSK